MKRFSVVGAASVIICLIAPLAHALEPKQCLPLAEMNAELKAAGQRSLVIGDRKAINDAPETRAGMKVTRFANLVTSNADGSLGFQIEGDMPRAQASTNMCVTAKLTNIRLLDARKPGVQPSALLGGIFDDEVRAKEKIGTRPMIIADTIHQRADGRLALGLPMILFGNIVGRSASIYARLADGSPAFLVLMGDADYTTEALRRLGN